MKFDNLAGGGAVGAALAILITHGDPSFADAEVIALAAGIGAIVTYVVRLGERLFFGAKDEEVE